MVLEISVKKKTDSTWIRQLRHPAQKGRTKNKKSKLVHKNLQIKNNVKQSRVPTLELAPVAITKNLKKKMQ